MMAVEGPYTRDLNDIDVHGPGGLGGGLSAPPAWIHQLTFQVPASKTVPALYPESAEFQVMSDAFATGFLVGVLEWPAFNW